MSQKDDFGIIITASKYDYPFLEGCISSIYSSFDDIKVAILCDGNFSTTFISDFDSRIEIITKNSIEDPFLRNNSFGYGITKMIAFWESPFEHFLLLDCDIILWGSSALDKLFENKEDIQFSRWDKGEKDKKTVIKKWFFNPDYLRKEFRNIDFLKYYQQYSNTGVICAKRDVFNLEDYKTLLKLWHKNPKQFFIGGTDLAFINILLALGLEDQTLSASFNINETVSPAHSQELMKSKFSFKNGIPDVRESTFIHFSGYTKAFSSNSNAWVEPMTYFRRKFWSKTLNSNYLIEENIIKGDKRLIRTFQNNLTFRIKRKLIFHTSRLKKIIMQP